MPEIRPFRALRYDPETVPDLAAVVAPPYDVIGPELHAKLLARDPRNVVRLDLPHAELREEPDERYRRAARTLAAWRSDGTLHKDPRPAIYVYEQTYRVPETDVERTQRGFFARLRLEAFGPDSGVLPHERTLAGAREDRYRLLRATGVNTSPVVGLFDDRSREADAILARLRERPATVEVRDDDAVVHRLWVVPAEAESGAGVGQLLGIASRDAITIADGHHRYETALRYRDERRMSRSCEEDPAFDYLLMLFLDTSTQPLTVLPTHRLVRHLGDDGTAHLQAGLERFFDVRPARREELEAAFADGLSAGGGGRFGLWTRAGGCLLTARRPAFRALGAGGMGPAASLDVSLLAEALEQLCGVDAEAVATGDKIRYTKSVADAIDQVDHSADGVDAAFLLEPTPVASVIDVARSGGVMPQKSTYFYPKALTGLVINPHEW